jgi:hypothetical protein
MRNARGLEVKWVEAITNDQDSGPNTSFPAVVLVHSRHLGRAESPSHHLYLSRKPPSRPAPEPPPSPLPRGLPQLTMPRLQRSKAQIKHSSSAPWAKQNIEVLPLLQLQSHMLLHEKGSKGVENVHVELATTLSVFVSGDE